MTPLEKYQHALVGSWGCYVRYVESVTGKKHQDFTAADWAYLSGHVKMLLDAALARLEATEPINKN
jgi:hypothetical protein